MWIWVQISTVTYEPGIVACICSSSDNEERGRDRQIPRVHYPGSVTEPLSARFSDWSCILKITLRAIKEPTQCQSLAFKHRCIHVETYIITYLHTTTYHTPYVYVCLCVWQTLVNISVLVDSWQFAFLNHLMEGLEEECKWLAYIVNRAHYLIRITRIQTILVVFYVFREESTIILVKSISNQGHLKPVLSFFWSSHIFKTCTVFGRILLVIAKL